MDGWRGIDGCMLGEVIDGGGGLMDGEIDR